MIEKMVKHQLLFKIILNINHNIYITNMESQKKKPRKKFTITIDAELLNKFDEHVDSIGYDKSRLVEKIIMMYMKNYESNK
jgi:hypothetical protein